jgi:hypothetical protein
MRVSVSVPNVLTFGATKFGMFVDYIQGLSDFDRFRFEFGLALRF